METIKQTNAILNSLGYKKEPSGIPKTIEALDEFKREVEERIGVAFVEYLEFLLSNRLHPEYSLREMKIGCKEEWYFEEAGCEIVCGTIHFGNLKLCKECQARKETLDLVKGKINKLKAWTPNADCWIDKEGKERQFTLETWEFAENICDNFLEMISEITALQETRNETH